jgi:DNA-binding response OmpR family regulator
VISPGFRRIVVLDRDPAAAFKLEQLLTAEGFWVTSAGDPRTALAWAREGGTDFLMVDMSLEVLDVVPRWERRREDPQPSRTPAPVSVGYAVLRPLAVDPGVARYVTVVLAGSRELPAREGAPRFALVGYVSKPVSRTALLPKLQSLVRSVRLAPKLRAPAPVSPTATGFGPEETILALDSDPLSDWGEEEPFASLPRPLRRALLLDTDAGYRGFLQDLLEGYGFTVHEADNHGTALELALEKRPWLIVTDALMPGGDGFEFCRAVRSQSLLARTPLFFVSAWDGLAERYRALQLGADDYLSKQAPTRELVIRVQLLLKRYSDLRGPGQRGASLEGAIDVVGAPGLLQMCHLGRLTGILTTRHEGHVATVRFRNGDIIAAESRRLRGAEAIYELVSWTAGHFEFQTQDPGEGPRLPESFDHLLLEGCRLLDESQSSRKVVSVRSLTRSRLPGPRPRSSIGEA